ncbi:hypothetical protein Arub01_42260 [Actinomadura rubrobrunea]|uniref:RDD domain-containing protein n=1 Tax=Actinomadura rubrobrunea TaxID=115335 RepID=A0A9W6Q0C4_9ACTN|nr:RDD family protein [Actinomadura rubrobrunea]GLW65982.1 hypothetical protein Arub01_42260 [Actinomadura rubrobrunea]
MAASQDVPGADPLPARGGEAAPEPAEPAQRLVARIVDTLIVGLPVVMVLREGFPGLHLETVAPPLVAGLLLVYEWIQLSLWGRTLGKRFAGIEVVREDPGRPATDRTRPGALRCLLRTVTYCLPVAIRPVPVFGVVAGLFWVANAAAIYESRLEQGARRRALHDRFAGTVVVKRPVAPAGAQEG